ncbi:hypothetical protein JB92DRAFT_3140170 [Gautieria morchelliformis]|nr:hypothetical protein JB92DRAFT_3140170 [Gautieria morchelliformis]
MNSPPEALSPSPSTPSSGSPSPDDAGLPTPSTSTAGGGVSQSQLANALASPNQAQTKRRLPTSASSAFSGREGREIKSRRRERDRDGGRDEESRKGGISWEPLRDAQVHGHSGPPSRLREELVDHTVVDYVRSTYGDPFDDMVLKQRTKSS